MSQFVRFVLGLDLGTTGVRALLHAPNGKLVASAYTSFPQYYPKPGWVEHDALSISNATLKMIRKACAQARCDFSEIASIGITNQRETVVLWDKKSGKPVAPAIVWQDRRTEPFCNQLKAKGLEKLIRSKTGLVLDPYFSATKIRWLLDHVPDLRRKVSRGQILAGTIDTWMLWQLTGRHATDCTNASRTLLFNIHTRKWDNQLLKIFGIPAALLPEVLPSGSLFGKTLSRPGIAAGVPVCAVLGDQQAALYGQNCVKAGEVKNTYGTGCFMMMNVGARKPEPMPGILTTLAADSKGRPVYAFEGAVFIAGAAVQWLRDGLEMVQTSEETDKLAQSVPDTHGMVFIPAFAGLGSPYWRSDVRGAIFGLTRGVTKRHFVRATLEAIAQQSADVFEAMRQLCPVPIRKIRTDGKAALNSFLMQYQADLLGLPVHASSQSEVTGWGVVRLAGEMIGFWNSSLDPARILKYRTYLPRKSKAFRLQERKKWQQAIQRLLSASV